MSHRVQIVIPDAVAARLEEMARTAGEPVATLAARIVRDGVERAASDSKTKEPAASSRTAETAHRRPPWLEPYGGDERWRRETWGAIVALHGRYPRHLQHLKDGWWKHESTTETLAALAAWRSEIDSFGSDPREELAFHHQLGDFAHTLHKQGGGVSQTWHPDPRHQSGRMMSDEVDWTVWPVDGQQHHERTTVTTHIGTAEADRRGGAARCLALLAL